MLQAQCPSCQTRYKVPDESAGRRAKCRKCGGAFTVPAALEDDIIPLSDLGDLSHGQPVRMASSAAAVALPNDNLSPPEAARVFQGYRAPAGRDEDAPAAVGGILPFLRDVGHSLAFPLRVWSLVTFLLMWLLVSLETVVQHGGCFGSVGMLIIRGWYVAFLLNVMSGATAGEKDLPEISISDGWVDGIIMPLLKFVVASLAALLPFVVGAVYLVALNQLDGSDAALQILFALGWDFHAAFSPDVGGGPLLGGLLIASVAIWPMLVLVVGVGGIASLVRIDLMGATIGKTLPGYLIMSAIAFAGVMGPAFLAVAFEAESGTKFALERLGVVAIASLAIVYGNIISMRAIGLYYHHFKERFAWSWG